MLTVEEAQAWYETSQPEFLLLKSGNSGKKTKVAMPEWKGAFAGKNDKVEVVETHIVTNGGFGFATENAYDQWKATDNTGYITSLTRLVVLKYRKTGEMVSFLMTIVGDKEYLETKHYEMWDNTYLTKDKNFSGLVLFHSTEGAFVNGWRYTNGKVTHTVNVNFDEGFGISLKSGYYDCTGYPVIGWFQDCTNYGYTVGEVDGNTIRITPQGTICSTPYMEFAGTIILCNYVDDGSGTGGTGGTYGPPSDLPCEGDPIKNPTIASSGASGTAGGMYGCVRNGADSRCNYQKKYHEGVDIESPLNANLYSMYSGEVIEKRSAFQPGEYLSGSYGNYITVRSMDSNGDYFNIKYSHLNSVNVNVGDQVCVQQIIGKTGNTGNAADDEIRPHIHIQAFRFNSSINPCGLFATTFNDNGAVTVPCN